MNAFEYVNPSTIEEVPALLGEGRDREAVIIAGGIDLLGELKDNLVAPGRLVNLKALPDLKTIRHGGEGTVIGATAPRVPSSRAKPVPPDKMSISTSNLSSNLCSR